jgi:hypothetical protein
MTLPRGQRDERPTAIKAQVPGLLKHRNPFPRAFKQHVEMLPSQVDPHHVAHAHPPLEGMVERCGYH